MSLKKGLGDPASKTQDLEMGKSIVLDSSLSAT
jgi:hypothetical protein